MDEIDIPTGWLDDLVLARDFVSPIASADLRRRVSHGELTRVLDGIYVDTARWNVSTPEARHLVLARANIVVRGRRLVLSHWSAAAAWGLPLIERIPEKTHVVSDRNAGGRSDERLVRHCLDIPENTVRIGGFEVTGLARTTVDVARIGGFEEAVGVADAALRGDGLALSQTIDKTDLAAQLGKPGSRGIARARAVIAFADGGAQSAGESLSRISIDRAGLQVPVLQQRFEDEHGEMFVDFWWPGCGVIGEFDGRGKYLREEFLRGRSSADVVVDEKWREDRLRALGPTVSRWGWSEARSPRALGSRLRRAGVR